MNVSITHVPSGGKSRSESTRPNDPATKLRGKSSAEALVPTELKRVVSTEPAKDMGGTTTLEAPKSSLQDAAAKANDYFRKAETHLEFEVKDLSGHTVVKVVDNESGEVIRELPPEELMRFSKITSELRGLLFEADG